MRALGDPVPSSCWHHGGPTLQQPCCPAAQLFRVSRGGACVQAHCPAAAGRRRRGGGAGSWRRCCPGLCRRAAAACASPRSCRAWPSSRPVGRGALAPGTIPAGRVKRPSPEPRPGRPFTTSSPRPLHPLPAPLLRTQRPCPRPASPRPTRPHPHGRLQPGQACPARLPSLPDVPRPLLPRRSPVRPAAPPCSPALAGRLCVPRALTPCGPLRPRCPCRDPYAAAYNMELWPAGLQSPTGGRSIWPLPPPPPAARHACIPALPAARQPAHQPLPPPLPTLLQSTS